MFIIAAGGNALSLLSGALVLINGPVLRSSRRFFAALFAPRQVSRRVIRERGGRGPGGRGDGEPRWNTYCDNYVTFCFATTRDFFLASVPTSRRTLVGSLPPPLPPPLSPPPPHESLALGSGIVSRLTKNERPETRGGGVNANEFDNIEIAAGRIYERRIAICMLMGRAERPLELDLKRGRNRKVRFRYKARVIMRRRG